MLARRIGLLCVLAAMATSCGDDAATATAAQTTAPVAPSSAPATAAPGTTAAPPTTAAATSTTAARTTTTTESPIDLHPVWGVAWADWLPPDGAGAVFSAVTFDDRTVEIPARFERGIEWHDATWDRVTFGSLEPGEEGAAVYLDTAAPWVIRLGGVASTSETLPDDVQEEELAEPLVVDLVSLLDGSEAAETVIALEIGDFAVDMGITFEISLVPASVEVPLGSCDATALHLVVGGQFIGGDDPSRTIEAAAWLHPEHFLLGWTEGPGFKRAELIETWG